MEFFGVTVPLAVAFAAGLVLGWNVLPQPAWVKRVYAYLTED